MSSLGVYFGPEAIVVVETKGRAVANNIRIPLSSFSAADQEEKVPDEIKMVAVFKDELRRNKINSKEASIALSGKDLIVRTFEMPVMPREELSAAIKFEAAKHLPFKMEELAVDYQVNFNKTYNKNIVLLMAIKKADLAKYIAIFQQLGIRLGSIQHATLNSIKLLGLAGAKTKGVVGVLSADVIEADEVGFTVIEDSFPIFSRDMLLKAESGSAQAPDQQQAQSMLLEKLKTEIRISLDFYNRNFPAKQMQKIFVMLNKEYQAELDAFSKEMGFDIEFVNTARFFTKPMPFSLVVIKAYAAALAKSIRGSVYKIDLLTALAREKIEKQKSQISGGLNAIIKGLRVEPRIVVLAVLICLGALGFGLYQKMPIKKELSAVISMRPVVAGVNPDAGVEELNSVSSAYLDKLKELDKLVKQQLFMTSPLSIVPRLMPNGVWLKSFSFDKPEGISELVLEGMAYAGDNNKEFALVNDFLNSLKEDSFFAKHFQDIVINSLDRVTIKDTSITSFKIICRSAQAGK